MYTDNINELLEFTIYPAIYDKLDQVFLEFEFRRTQKGWESTNTTKIDGRDGKTRGQVICSNQKPAVLADHSDGMYVTFWDYVQRQGDLSNADTLQKLASLAGVELTGRNRNTESLQEQQKKAKAAQIWELFLDHAKDQLWNSTDAEVKEYLTGRRQYTPEDVKQMDLGQAGDWTKAEAYVKERTGYTEDEIREVLTYNRTAIGNTHRLIIPIRDAAGRMMGIAARNIKHTSEDKLPKYLNSTGLQKGSILFGLPARSKKDKVILVEGQLDAAIANARQYEFGTVAAIGGKDLSKEQVQYLLNTRTRDLTICLDNEEATRESIRKAIKLVHTMDTDEQIADRIYVAMLPAGIKDTDELITKQGIEAFDKAIKQARIYSDYLAEEAIESYNTSDRTDRDANDFIDSIELIASGMKSPAKKEDMMQRIEQLAEQSGIFIRQEAWQAAADRIKARNDQAAQESMMNEVLRKAKKKADAGELDDAIQDLETGLRRVKLRSKQSEYESIYAALMTQQNVIDAEKNRPPSARTGIYVNVDGTQEELCAPAGQITFFAAPTGHGKTAIMLNVALSILESQPERSIHYFTYEMDAVSILKFALNVYIGDKISSNNQKSITSYFRERTDKYITDDKKEFYHERKNKFFSELIDTGRLKIVHKEYSSDEMIGYIEYIKNKDPQAVIIIDYVQKLRSDKAGNINHRPTELKFVCEDINRCAIDTSLPVIMAAQFARVVQSPVHMHATALAEASDIEKIASEVYGIWNCARSTAHLDANELKRLSKYDIKGDTEFIIQILKSRTLPTDLFTKMRYEQQSKRMEPYSNNIFQSKNSPKYA
jgi:DNA primase catalytic core